MDTHGYNGCVRCESHMSGPISSLCIWPEIAVCCAQEGTAFLTPSTESQMVVDRSVHGDLLRVNFNISFPALACEFASLDISDALGTVSP